MEKYMPYLAYVYISFWKYYILYTDISTKIVELWIFVSFQL